MVSSENNKRPEIDPGCNVSRLRHSHARIQVTPIDYTVLRTSCNRALKVLGPISELCSSGGMTQNGGSRRGDDDFMPYLAVCNLGPARGFIQSQELLQHPWAVVVLMSAQKSSVSSKYSGYPATCPHAKKKEAKQLRAIISAVCHSEESQSRESRCFSMKDE